jgi:hypothetical protein
MTIHFFRAAAPPHCARLTVLVLLAVLMPTCVPLPPAATLSECPLRTPVDWQLFLRRYASDPRWGKTCEEGNCDDRFAREIDDVLVRCSVVFAQSSAISACTANLRSFIPTWLRQHDAASYGFNTDNRAYFAAQEDPELPHDMMKPPPEILAAIPDLQKIEQAASQHGIRWLVQDSCLSGGRMFMLISGAGDAFDAWMLLNLGGRLPNLSVDVEKTMSFLAVQKKDARGRSFPKTRLHFRDYVLSPAGGGYRATPGDTSTKCYACHISGVRQLISRRTPFLYAAPVNGEGSAAPDLAMARLRMFDERLRSYGLPDWNGTIDVPRLGPPIGAEQGCTACHDGQYRGVLTMMTSTEQILEKVQYELSMPPAKELARLFERSEMREPPLVSAEQQTLDAAAKAHKRLAQVVLDGRSATLSRWLLATPCY